MIRSRAPIQVVELLDNHIVKLQREIAETGALLDQMAESAQTRIASLEIMHAELALFEAAAARERALVVERAGSPNAEGC